MGKTGTLVFCENQNEKYQVLLLSSMGVNRFSNPFACQSSEIEPP
jgi:hypothetical protein